VLSFHEIEPVNHSRHAGKLGDQIARGKLIGGRQVIITAHGHVGVRAMPPRGGKEDLSVEQFAQALNYMVNKSGGHWALLDKPISRWADKGASAPFLIGNRAKIFLR
jgi:hypothetical protein